MKIVKSKLKRVIKEEVESYFDEFRQYTTKGAWVIKSLGEDAYYVRMRYHPHLEPVWGTREEAKIFDNELEAKVRKDIIEKEGIQATVENMSEELEETKKKKQPSEKSIKKAHASLEKTAKKKFPKDEERQNKYIYGTKRKMGWKPEREK